MPGRGRRNRGRGQARGRRGRGRRSITPNREAEASFNETAQDEPEGHDDPQLAAALRQSLIDERSRKSLQEQEEEQLRRAIAMSLESTSTPTTGNEPSTTASGSEGISATLDADENVISSSSDQYFTPKSNNSGIDSESDSDDSSDQNYQPCASNEKFVSETFLRNEEVVQRMNTMFESSLALHETGNYMEPAKAIRTKLYPHQKYALAWMSKRENTKAVEVPGGILADDMGLGKTLTMISLIVTNFHDGRPLKKPIQGFKRSVDRQTAKFLPIPKFALANAKRMPSNVQSEPEAKKAKPSLFTSNIFSGMASPSSAEKRLNVSLKRRKDNRLPVKSSRFKQSLTCSVSSLENPFSQNLDDLDDSILSENEEDDEFDALLESQSLSEKLRVDVEASKLLEKPSEVHYDGLSDDEEYQSMTQEERNEKMRPKLNLDGAISLSENSDDEEPSSTTNGLEKKPIRSRRRKVSSDDELPDVNFENDLNSNGSHQKGERSKQNNTDLDVCVPDLSPAQKKNLIVQESEPAICGSRRRPTLIVTPSSLISHWIQQIEEHVDKRVDLNYFVHYGSCKATLSLELERRDIVLTTYGTLSSELSDPGPLLKTRWLRVCLDEGHQVKNNQTKMARAASELNTERKWIISGTPIQNNLGELWSLLHFLRFPPYAEHRPLFKKQIENPLKYGSQKAIRLLQTIVQSICLRRTKSDMVNGRPLVTLPSKTVTVRTLEFTKEERAVYDTYHSKGRDQILKYMKRGTLLKNYAHVFVVMLRLRQLCCHRELLPVHWKDLPIDEIIRLASEDAANNAAEEEKGKSEEEDSDALKKLAEKLRDMIREGTSDECSICLSEFDHPVITPCAHVYCRPCITQHIECAKPPPARCPLCRGILALSTLLEAAPPEEEENEDKSLLASFEDIVVDVSSTKVNAALQELLGVRRDFPDDKVIVVSQFTSFLSVLQPLLTAEDIEWTRLDGSMTMKERSSTIAKFQSKSPDSPKVLLLSLRAGGLGLNLTSANRVLLLDPAWNPSTEEQCFDRVHRLGQLKPVFITKFIMKNSIEERMLAIQEKKRNLISGAFRQTEQQRQQQRIQDIREIFNI